jgi:hypothetical protein
VRSESSEDEQIKRSVKERSSGKEKKKVKISDDGDQEELVAEEEQEAVDDQDDVQPMRKSGNRQQIEAEDESDQGSELIFEVFEFNSKFY